MLEFDLEKCQQGKCLHGNRVIFLSGARGRVTILDLHSLTRTTHREIWIPRILPLLFALFFVCGLSYHQGPSLV